MTKIFLTTKEAAELTKLSVAWFNRARWNGSGPKYVKIGNAVRYDESVLLEWLAARERQSTSA